MCVSVSDGERNFHKRTGEQKSPNCIVCGVPGSAADATRADRMSNLLWPQPLPGSLLSRFYSVFSVVCSFMRGVFSVYSSVFVRVFVRVSLAAACGCLTARPASSESRQVYEGVPLQETAGSAGCGFHMAVFHLPLAQPRYCSTMSDLWIVASPSYFLLPGETTVVKAWSCQYAFVMYYFIESCCHSLPRCGSVRHRRWPLRCCGSAAARGRPVHRVPWWRIRLHGHRAQSGAKKSWATTPPTQRKSIE